jgi:hypothetical protein
MAGRKTSCPVTRSEFKQHAKPLMLSLDGKEIQADVKEFSTGSCGWNINAKVTVMLNGTPVSVQIGANFTIVGSKELPSVEEEQKQLGHKPVAALPAK